MVKLAGVTLVTQLWHSRFPLGVGTRVGQQTCANHGCDHLAHKSTLCLTTNLSAPVTLAASFYVAAWVHDVLVKLAGVTLVTQLWHSPFPPHTIRCSVRCLGHQPSFATLWEWCHLCRLNSTIFPSFRPVLFRLSLGTAPSHHQSSASGSQTSMGAGQHPWRLVSSALIQRSTGPVPGRCGFSQSTSVFCSL